MPCLRRSRRQWLNACGGPFDVNPALPTAVAGAVSTLGDSITAGTTVTTPWPTTLGTALGGSYPVTNNGVNASTTSDLVTRWFGTIKGTGKKWLTVLGGVVDALNSVPAEVAILNLKTIYENAMRDGVRVVPITILPYGSYASWTSGGQAIIDAINTWIRSYCAARSIPYVEAYNSALNDGAGNLATIYNGDGLHPNQAGADYIETLVRAKFP